MHDRVQVDVVAVLQEGAVKGAEANGLELPNRSAGAGAGPPDLLRAVRDVGLRAVAQEAGHDQQVVGVPGVVAVEIGDQLPARSLEPCVPRRGDSPVLGQGDQVDPIVVESLDVVGGAVLTAVVDHDQLPVVMPLGLNRVDRGLERAQAIVRRRDHGDQAVGRESRVVLDELPPVGVHGAENAAVGLLERSVDLWIDHCVGEVVPEHRVRTLCAGRALRAGHGPPAALCRSRAVRAPAHQEPELAGKAGSAALAGETVSPVVIERVDSGVREPGPFGQVGGRAE